jgi:aromatase
LSELATLRVHAENRDRLAALTFSFADTVSFRGDLDKAYAFVDEADQWASRLPHVASVTFRRSASDLQDLLMETRAVDGSTHVTRSFRVGAPRHSIIYKQVTLPGLLTLHLGEWRFQEVDGLVEVTSVHTVRIREGKVQSVLGPGADVAAAKEYVQNALSTNSRATLGLCRAFAAAR